MIFMREQKNKSYSARHSTAIALEYYAGWIRSYSDIQTGECHAEDGGDDTGLEHLLWMCETCLNMLEDNAPLDKCSRWLGYIQGCLICQGYTTTKIERDRTRPWFT